MAMPIALSHALFESLYSAPLRPAPKPVYDTQILAEWSAASEINMGATRGQRVLSFVGYAKKTINKITQLKSIVLLDWNIK